MKYDIVKLMARRKIRWKKRWVSGDSGGRLTFRSKKAGRLSDYRIYGNTVDGESVGDRTGNLWGINGAIAFSNDVSVKSKDGEFIIQSSGINGTISAKSPQYQNKFKLHLTTGTYTYSYRYNEMSVNIVMGVYTLEGETLNSNFTLLNDTDIYIGFYIPSNTTCNQRWMFMLNEGSTPLPYEPYGYKVPVTVSNGTDTQTIPIYLPEQIRKVGNEAEYIDYAEQKMHRVRKNLFDGEFLQGYWAWVDGLFNVSDKWICTKKIPCKSNAQYTFSSSFLSMRAGFLWYDENGNYLSTDTAYNITLLTKTSPSNTAYMAINIAGPNSEAYIKPSDVTDFMLVEGSTPLPYEPYHTPETTNIYLPKPIKMVGDEAEYIDYAEQKQHVDADEEIEKQATTYMVSITPKTDVSKIEFLTMSNVPVDCTILTSGLIFTLDEADENTLNSTNYADGVRGNASKAHNYRYRWTKRYTEGQTIYIRSYVKYQTADNEIKEVYGDVYKADINGFERVRENLHVTLPALPTLTGTNVLSVGTAVQPSRVEVKGRIKAVGQETEPEQEAAEAEQEEPEVKEDDTDDR